MLPTLLVPRVSDITTLCVCSVCHSCVSFQRFSSLSNSPYELKNTSTPPGTVFESQLEVSEAIRRRHTWHTREIISPSASWNTSVSAVLNVAVSSPCRRSCEMTRASTFGEVSEAILIEGRTVRDL